MELLIGLIVGCFTGVAGSALWFFPQRESLKRKDDKIAHMSAAFKKARSYNSQLEDEIQKIKESRLKTLQTILESRLEALQKFEESQLEKLQKLEESYRDLSCDEIVTIQALDGDQNTEYIGEY
ncbi:MAG: hypothetical protein AB4038_17610 [Prochloraceae cyanobacterium]